MPSASGSPTIVRDRGSRSSSSRGVRVLVTGGEFTGALAAVRALAAARYEPWVAASDLGAYAARSRAAFGVIRVPSSADDPDGFIEKLRSASEARHFSAMVAGSERDLLAIARCRQRLGDLAMGTPERATVLAITSKSTVNRTASEVGLKIPPTVETDRDGLSNGSSFPGPLVVKPMRSELESTGGGLMHLTPHRVNTPAEMGRLVPTLIGDRWLIQPCIEGKLGAICGVAWQGTVVSAVHQVTERIWPTDIGISAYARTVPRDQELEAGVARLVSALGWSGIFQAQFIHTERGSFLIDLNPRIYGSLALAIAAGVNLPAILVALLAGETVHASPYRVGVRYRTEQDIRALFHLGRTGELAAASRGLIPKRRTAHAVVSLKDPLPAMSRLARLISERRGLPSRLDRRTRSSTHAGKP